MWGSEERPRRQRSEEKQKGRSSQGRKGRARTHTEEREMSRESRKTEHSLRDERELKGRSVGRSKSEGT